MTKEEFQKLIAEEQAKGQKAAGLVINTDELTKICVAMKMADKIICQVGDNATKEKNMELCALCLLATEGIDMVQEKFILPIMEGAKAGKKTNAEAGKEKKAEE